VVAPIHSQAMLVILTTDDERNVWMRALWPSISRRVRDLWARDGGQGSNGSMKSRDQNFLESSQLGQCERSMIVTMTVVRMMEPSVDQIVDVVAVRDCLVSAAGPVSMTGADVVWRALHRVGSVHCYRVLIDMVAVHVMQMAVVDQVEIVWSMGNQAADLRINWEQSNRQTELITELGDNQCLIDEFGRRMHEHRVHFCINRTLERRAKIAWSIDGKS
jgi:hypothetical protein